MAVEPSNVQRERWSLPRGRSWPWRSGSPTLTSSTVAREEAQGTQTCLHAHVHALPCPKHAQLSHSRLRIGKSLSIVLLRRALALFVKIWIALHVALKRVNKILGEGKIIGTAAVYRYKCPVRTRARLQWPVLLQWRRLPMRSSLRARPRCSTTTRTSRASSDLQWGGYRLQGPTGRAQARDRILVSYTIQLYYSVQGGRG